MQGLTSEIQFSALAAAQLAALAVSIASSISCSIQPSIPYRLSLQHPYSRESCREPIGRIAEASRSIVRASTRLTVRAWIIDCNGCLVI